MKTLKTTLTLTLILVMIQSCRKDLPENNQNTATPGSMKEMVVSKDFSWLSYDKTHLQIKIQSSEVLDGEVIYLYDDNYRTIEKAIITNNQVVFNSSIPMSNDFVVAFIPTTRSQLKITDYTGKKIYTMGASNLYKDTKSFINSPDCNTNCDNTKAGNYSSLTINNSTTCLTGTLTGNLTLKNNATLKICGNATILNINFTGNGEKKIIITSYGSLQLNNLNLNNNCFIENYSDNCAITSITVNSGVENYGTMNITTLNLNNGWIHNDGTMNITNSVNIGDEFTNNGSLNCNGNISISGSDVENNCKMISLQSISVNHDMENNGYMKAGQNFTLNGADIDMGGNSMISTTNLTLNGELNGTAALSAVKVSNSTVINGSGEISGVVNFCDANGIETNNGTIGSSVTSCSGYIPISSCNPEGIGTPYNTDSDNDGIIDNLDDYPNNPNLAFINYSPYSGYKTITFEDLWPSLGDFDFNDVVLKTRIKYNSNAQNKIVSANVEVVLYAVGAGLHNGIGLQFLNSNNAAISGLYSSVNGAVVDPQDSKSVKVCNDIFSAQSTYYSNTSLTHAKTPDTLAFTINFNTSGGGWTASDLTDDFYIFRTNDRSLEVHVADRPPTPAADLTQFNSYDDNTNAATGTYYKNKNNLPWGIEIIDGNGDFLNPLEKVDIVVAYPQLPVWVTSNGNQNKQWHKNPVANKVFHSNNNQ